MTDTIATPDGRGVLAKHIRDGNEQAPNRLSQTELAAARADWLQDIPRRNIPRVLCLTGGVDGCLLWRVWWTCAHLSSYGFIADYVRYEDINQLYPLIRTGRYNMVVTPRFVWRTHEAAEEWLEAIRRDKLAWCYEADDDLWSPEIVDRQMGLYPPGHPRADRDQFEWERIERTKLVKFADGITVSSDGLREVVEQNTKAPVKTVENYIDVAWWRNVLAQGQRRVPGPTVGWMGGTREERDLLPMADAWRRLADQYPAVNFIIHGYPAPCLVDAVPRARLYILPWATIERYPQSLLNFDIGCCSVADEPWNWRKTPIKWFEFSLAGAACVVTPTLYGPVVQDGHDAFIARTPDEWYSRLSALVESPELRQSMNANAVARVETRHSMQANWFKWVGAWSEILEAANA